MGKAFLDNGSYRLHFYYKGRQYRYRIKNGFLAEQAQNYINHLIPAIKQNVIELPHGVNIKDYVLNKVEEKFPALKTKNRCFSSKEKNLLQVLDEYEIALNHSDKSENTKEGEKTHMRNLIKYIQQSHYAMHIAVSDLPANFFEDYKAYRRKDVKEITVFGELKTFYRILRDYNEDTSTILFPKKMKIYRKFKGPKYLSDEQAKEALKVPNLDEKTIKELNRFRYFNNKQLGELISLAKGKRIYPTVITSVATGMRRGELAKLKWEDINFEAREITVYSDKQSKQCKDVARVIPMDKHLRDFLLEHKRKQNNCFVFTNSKNKQMSPNKLSKDFQKLVYGTKFECIGYHSFRHSMASNLYREKEDQRVISEILGHTTREMEERYRHTFPQQNKHVLENYLHMGDQNG